MGGARKKARDSKRKQDIVQIEKALVLYWEKYDQFPGETWCDSSVGSCGSNCPCDPLQDNWSVTSAIYTGLVGNDIIGYLPIDPKNDATHYYWYEPCCNQNCAGGRTCVGMGCCEYTIGAKILEATGSSFSRTGRWEP